jgi:hypothetical protein
VWGRPVSVMTEGDRPHPWLPDRRCIRFEDAADHDADLAQTLPKRISQCGRLWRSLVLARVGLVSASRAFADGAGGWPVAFGVGLGAAWGLPYYASYYSDPCIVWDGYAWINVC